MLPICEQKGRCTFLYHSPPAGILWSYNHPCILNIRFICIELQISLSVRAHHMQLKRHCPAKRLHLFLLHVKYTSLFFCTPYASLPAAWIGLAGVHAKAIFHMPGPFPATPLACRFLTSPKQRNSHFISCQNKIDNGSRALREISISDTDVSCIEVRASINNR